MLLVVQGASIGGTNHQNNHHVSSSLMLCGGIIVNTCGVVIVNTSRANHHLCLGCCLLGERVRLIYALVLFNHSGLTLMWIGHLCLTLFSPLIL